MTHQDPIVIACGADAAYASPLAVLLQSVTARLPADRRVEFHVIDGGLGTDLRAKVVAGLERGRVSIHWLAPQRDEFVGLPLWGRMRISTYDKLQIPTLLPASVRKALWLDADILALASVSELWDRDLGDRLALAARDSLVPSVSASFGVAAYRELGLDAAAPYFNAGVLLVNVDGWRRANVTRRSLEYLQRHCRRVYFWDQEALNAVLAGSWEEIETRWNWSPSLGASEASPALVHFTGNLKPWRCVSPTPWHDRFYETLDQTGWRGWRPRERRGGWGARYEASPVRRWLRPMERWAMRGWRRCTLRYATRLDVQLTSVFPNLSGGAGHKLP